MGYEELEGVRQSHLKRILKSPAHFKFGSDFADEEKSSPALLVGDAIHAAILEPDRFNAEFIVSPEFSGTGSRKAKEEWLGQNGDKKVLTEAQHNQVIAAKRSLRESGLYETANKILSGGSPEHVFQWVDVTTGIKCKGKADYVKPGIVIDLKSTIDASPKSFSRSIVNFGYLFQCAYYLDGMTHFTGEEHKDFIIIALEKTPPYGVNCFYLTSDDIQIGRRQYKKALGILYECLERDEWPGYSDGLTELILPKWARGDE